MICHDPTITLTSTLAFFAMGLSGSLHCAGMCGPLLALWAPGAQPTTRKTAPNNDRSASHFSRDAHSTAGTSATSAQHTRDFSRVRALLLYHVGRVWSYGWLAVIVALVAARAHPLIPPRVFLMIACGMLLITAFHHTAIAPRGVMPLLIRALRPLTKLPAEIRPLLIGLATPLLPCGLLYTIVSACAAAPNVRVALQWMLAFVVGTIPLLALSHTTLAWLRTRLTPAHARGLAIASALTSGALLLAMQS